MNKLQPAVLPLRGNGALSVVLQPLGQALTFLLLPPSPLPLLRTLCPCRRCAYHHLFRSASKPCISLPSPQECKFSTARSDAPHLVVCGTRAALRCRGAGTEDWRPGQDQHKAVASLSSGGACKSGAGRLFARPRRLCIRVGGARSARPAVCCLTRETVVEVKKAHAAFVAAVAAAVETGCARGGWAMAARGAGAPPVQHTSERTRHPPGAGGRAPRCALC